VILDSGANCNFLNFKDINITNFNHYVDEVKLGDSHSVESIGTGNYGKLAVTIVPNMHSTLISESYLTKVLGLCVLKDDGRAFIFKRMYVSHMIESDICN
jgi:hypothetical protein